MLLAKNLRAARKQVFAEKTGPVTPEAKLCL